MDRHPKEDVDAAMEVALGPYIGIKDLKVLASEVHHLRGDLAAAELREAAEYVCEELKAADWSQLAEKLEVALAKVT